MRLLTSTFLCLVLLTLHVLYKPSQISTVHTYVPPLTHTPGLGLSIIGIHSEPPFSLFDTLHNETNPQLQMSIDRQLQQHKTKLDTGVRLRMTMQRQTLQLLESLPDGIVHEAWKNRSTHEKSIGEVSTWDELLVR